MPCSVIHDHSCEMHFVKRFLLVFNLAYKFYIPIHVLPALIFKRRKLTKEPLKILKAAAKNILKSTLFISCYVSFYWYFICKIKNYRKCKKTLSRSYFWLSGEMFTVWSFSTLSSLFCLLALTPDAAGDVSPHRKTSLLSYDANSSLIASIHNSRSGLSFPRWARDSFQLRLLPQSQRRLRRLRH